MDDYKDDGISTRAVHSGEVRFNEYGAVTTPIVQTSTFIFKNVEEIRKLVYGDVERFEYGRYGHPTQMAAERKLAALEETEDAVLFSSGMSAITTSLFMLLKAGDHLIITDDAYKRTLDFCKSYLGRYNIECTVVKMCDYEAMEKAIKPNTKVFFSESPTNPYLNIMDLERLMDIFGKRDITVISDSTFATPYNQKPLEYGVHLVIHSATKYLAGHNDLLSGVLLGKKELTDPIREFLKITGGVIDPNSSYLLIRGLKTFPLRMERLNKNAQIVAEHLEENEKIKRVYYPGLASHPHHEVAKRQLKGFGAVVTFEVKDDSEYVLDFLSRLHIISIGPSLGGVESLITHPATISYYMHTREERLELGIKDGLIRLAVGIEDPEDIVRDIDQALSAAESARAHKA
ncbi:MAG: trans-sulfuration enzyme family protein [Desulfobacterales bacterium]